MCIERGLTVVSSSLTIVALTIVERCKYLWDRINSSCIEPCRSFALRMDTAPEY
jgi:hypothetical protein